MIDLSKPYRTKDGREAWAVKSLVPFNVGSAWVDLIGWTETANGCRYAHYWKSDGKSVLSPATYDLVNVPETRTVKLVWNVYLDRLVQHDTRSDAEDCAGRDRIACIEREITFTVGEGLEP